MLIDNLLEKRVKELKGVYKYSDTGFLSEVKFNNERKRLMYSICPYTCYLVKELIEKDLEKGRVIINPNKYITKTNDGRYRIRKRGKNKDESFGIFTTIEDARAERDLLIDCNWCFDSWVEGNDEEISFSGVFDGKRKEYTTY